LDNQNFDTTISINGLSIDSYSTGVTLPIETLIDEIKPVIAKKSLFIKLHLSKMMALFKNFGLWGFNTN